MDLGVPGRRLYAYTGGKPFDPRLPCVVFIHGAQNDHSVWILQSRYFAHHGRAVLALDLPGHSRSDGPAERTVAAIAERIAAALSPLASPRLLLAGHSLGSLIALEVARRLPARVAGVALIGTAAPMRVSDALLAATRDDPAAAMDMINVWSHSAALAAFERKLAAWREASTASPSAGAFAGNPCSRLNRMPARWRLPGWWDHRASSTHSNRNGWCSRRSARTSP